MAKKNKKEKKEKVIYYDDNRTIADMSNVSAIGRSSRAQKEKRSKATFREKWKTYWAAVKMMLIPMFVVLAIICVVFLLMIFLGR
jgi:maltodextrin utilization protein YvdJ